MRTPPEYRHRNCWIQCTIKLNLTCFKNSWRAIWHKFILSNWWWRFLNLQRAVFPCPGLLLNTVSRGNWNAWPMMMINTWIKIGWPPLTSSQPLMTQIRLTSTPVPDTRGYKKNRRLSYNSQNIQYIQDLYVAVCCNVLQCVAVCFIIDHHVCTPRVSRCDEKCILKEHWYSKAGKLKYKSN